MTGAVTNVTLAIAAVCAALLWALLSAVTSTWWIGLPAAVAVGVLVCQLRAAQVAQSVFRERDEALPLLHSATPKLIAGLPIDSAFILADQELRSTTSGVIAGFCARARLGIGLDAAPGSAAAGGAQPVGALGSVLVTMIAAARRNGGDVARPFASLASMIETDQRLRSKQAIASLHVRAQANALIGIALIVLALVFVGNQESLLFLRETLDGRRMLTVCISFMLWGYVILTALTAAIVRV